ncbi:MAG: hypothetical protein QXL43_04960, partial [Methanolinea sp.]
KVPKSVVVGLTRQNKLGLEAPLEFRTLVQTTGGEFDGVRVQKDKKEFVLRLRDGREFSGQLSRVVAKVDGQLVDLKKIADGEPFEVPPTIEDPSVLGEVARSLSGIGYPRART